MEQRVLMVSTASHAFVWMDFKVHHSVAYIVQHILKI
jgi:hypothetical protein